MIKALNKITGLGMPETQCIVQYGAAMSSHLIKQRSRIKGTPRCAQHCFRLEV